MSILIDEQLPELMGCESSVQDVRRLRAFLNQHGTFEFPALETGLFAAARLSPDALYTGYDNVWVRDNIHVAYVHLVTGHREVAERTIAALTDYFQRHRRRFEAIIQGEADPADPMNRPHVRFNGRTLDENPEKWSHAQNDALGYFLWLACRLLLAEGAKPSLAPWDLFGLFPLYFAAIRYWQDEDSGHWEETRKIAASSIGTVVAGLRELRRLMIARSLPSFSCLGKLVSVPMLEELIGEGRAALAHILPAECIQENPAQRRRTDAALLFLIYPLQVVDDAQADQILHDVTTHLQGDYGIRRYQGDSFWCADYKARQAPERRTSDVSDDMTARDALLQPGQEAQWCLFDPLLSAFYGQRYQASREKTWLCKQVSHLNRSLRQLTDHDSGFPAFRCPELYYSEQGRCVPNDVTPLLWTQAHLSLALHAMELSARLHTPG